MRKFLLWVAVLFMFVWMLTKWIETFVPAPSGIQEEQQ